jgi:glycosyltransferase involved in cell wall biosynthesis
MRALILTDADIAAREASMLSRLEIGLLGQNVRILYAEPSDDRLHIDAESLITGLTYTSGGSILTLKARARRLVRDIDEHIGFDDPSSSRLDVVHAIGVNAWSMALQTASSAGSNLVVEVLSQSELDRVRSFEASAARALGDEARFAWLAPGQAMHDALREQARKSPVLLTPWGAHVSEAMKRPRPSEQLPAVAIITAGRSSKRLNRLLDTLKALPPAEGSNPPLIFLDEHAVSQTHTVARHAREIGIEDRLSIVPSLEHSRALTTRCDLLVLPDGDGQNRSIILDAMASGVLVASAADPLLSDVLIDGTTALIAHETGADSWKAILQRALNAEGDGIAEILANARALIKEDRTASTHVDALVAAYDAGCGAEPIPFK